MGGTRRAFGASAKANRMVLKGSTKSDRKKRELAPGTFSEMGRNIFTGKKRLTRTSGATARANKMGQEARAENTNRRMIKRRAAEAAAGNEIVPPAIPKVKKAKRAAKKKKK